MKPASEGTVPKEPPQSNDSPTTEIPLCTIFGFPVSTNQFNELQESETAVSTSQRQVQERRNYPNKTRLTRLQAARRTDEQEMMTNEGNTLSLKQINDEQEILENEGNGQPVSSDIRQLILPDSLSVSPTDILTSQSVGNVHYLLGTGANMNDALYDCDLYDVACMENNCNKRINVAGPERSAGRPGHMPKGARSAACLSSYTACIGPYGTASRQLHHTSHNTREETHTMTSSTELHQQEGQSINPQRVSYARSNAVEDHALPAKVVMQPCKPPYFYGEIDDEVHVWTSIVNSWLNAVQGEPSTQLTFIVSLLRGVAHEWYL